jgi:hypothetical protein
MTLVLLNDDTPPRVIPRVAHGEARREDRLRDLIHDNPAILPVHDLDPSFGRLFTVARELSLPGVGFVDLLLADENGRLVIVECKLWRNPQARREVVGQILDYARELARYGYETLQTQISIARGETGNILHAMAREAGSTLDEARFVDRVTRDLAAGRFLLLVVGDGITEGTQRISEYLGAQPGLAFEFGLVEMVEYRHAGGDGVEQVIVHPRLLARTTVIERHVIRVEAPGFVVDAVAPVPETATRTGSLGSGGSEASFAWGRFVERFVAETRFDDPGQPPPRRGGTGWIRVPLPGTLYINLYRSLAEGGIGAQVRFPGSEGRVAWETLFPDRDAIDAEFEASGLPCPVWTEGDVPKVEIAMPFPAPWYETAEIEQRRWMALAANRFVNSLRPRLQRLTAELAA